MCPVHDRHSPVKGSDIALTPPPPPPGPVRKPTGPRVNEAIRIPSIRVVGPDGAQLGLMTNVEGMAKAKSMGLDLVEIAPLAKPPVCKIMNFGKYKYELKKRERKIRHQERGKGLKEIKFSPKIDPHDYETKMRHIREFVIERGKAKVTIMFRGREVVHKDLGHKLLDKLVKDTADVAYIEQPAKDEGPNITMLLGAKPGVMGKAPAPKKEEEEPDAKTQDA